MESAMEREYLPLASPSPRLKVFLDSKFQNYGAHNDNEMSRQNDSSELYKDIKNGLRDSSQITTDG